ncbi:MAG: FUN14 domain-containing protein [Candidatus Bipolaricaulia bacterium]
MSSRSMLRFALIPILLIFPALWTVAQLQDDPDAVSSTVIPLVSQLGFGGVVGLVVGFTLKKVGKLIAIAFGLFFILLQVLAYYGLITIDWNPIADWWARFTDPETLQSRWEALRAILFSNLPAFGGAIPGFVLGLKVG